MFEGLLPEPHNHKILQLLFTFAHWHGLAKLRMHTDTTLALLDDKTTVLGQQLRDFQSTICSTYKTHELKREMKARERREGKKSGLSAPLRGVQGERQLKTLNLNTYKFHSLGDYVSMIKQYGTTDSYTTALVSCLQILKEVHHNYHCRVSWNIEHPKRGINGRARKDLCGN